MIQTAEKAAPFSSPASVMLPSAPGKGRDERGTNSRALACAAVR